RHSDVPRRTPMTGFADYDAHDALGLATLVRQRKVTPADLLEAAIARVEARNGAVNAVTMPLYDLARATLARGLPEGPFTGVPFLMKDLTASIAGVKMTRGSRFFADTPPPAADSEHVARLKRAGLVIFGRTNTCELGLSLTCEPQLHGPTRNPWDPTRISGGSSGGAAAARLRIAWTATPPNGAPIDAEPLRVLRETAALCADLGHQVEQAEPAIDGATVVTTFLTLAAANTAVNLAGHPTAGRPPQPDEVERVTWATGQIGERLSAADYVRATQAAH